jgi:hypothetical protein
MPERFASQIRWLSSLAALVLAAVTVLSLPPNALCASQEFPVLSPPLKPDIFPCSACHSGMEPDTTKRQLSMHAEIKLRHAPKVLAWCLACHDPKDISVRNDDYKHQDDANHVSF